MSWEQATFGWPLPDVTLTTGTTYSPWFMSSFAKSGSFSVDSDAVAGGPTTPTMDISIESTLDRAALQPGHTVTNLNTVTQFQQIASAAQAGETRTASVYKSTPDKFGNYIRWKVVIAANSGTPVYTLRTNTVLRGA